MKSIKLPNDLNYIGVFLTFKCPYKCSFCINNYKTEPRFLYSEIEGQEWIKYLLKLDSRDIPITLQGGEPGAHKDFILIVENLVKYKPIDILTTLKFDLKKFVNRIDPELLKRNAPYSSIRVSYHPEQFSRNDLLERILFLKKYNFDVGVYGVLHPDQIEAINRDQHFFTSNNVEFKTKEFLGQYQGQLHGNYSDEKALTLKNTKNCKCKTSELLIAPNGDIHRCHHDLYEVKEAISNIKEKLISHISQYQNCNYYGKCHPCDLKIKNNRFQEFGHVSVSIKDICDKLS